MPHHTPLIATIVIGLVAAFFLVAGGPDNLLPILNASGKGNVVADNWLRLAATVIADDAVAAKRSLPVGELESYLKDTKHTPQSRLLAFDVIRQADAAKAVALLRSAGFSAELFASGSPRKRYDKARKAEPAILVSFDIRDGEATHSLLHTDPAIDREGEALLLFNEHWPIALG